MQSRTTGNLSAPWFHILLALADQDRHGYGIMQEVELRSGGSFRLWPATLYTAIKKMMDAGLLEPTTPVGADANDDGRRRYYRITAAGQKALKTEADRMAQLVAVARDKEVVA